MRRTRPLFFAALAAALMLAFEAGVRHELLAVDDEGCSTDSCVFAQCSRELKRPCTDDDVFGHPEDSDEEECHPDDSTCWNEREEATRE